MSINFSTSFADLGKLFAAIANLDGAGGKTAPSSTSYWGTSSAPVVKCQNTMFNDILTRLEGSGLTSLLTSARSLPAIANLDQTIQNVKQACATDLQSVLLTRVNNDVPQQQASNLTLAMLEFVRQMKAVIAPPVQANPSASSGGSLSDTTYYWVITAVTAAGETTASNEKSLTISGSNQTANLSWAAVTNAVSYNVYRGTAAGSENHVIANVTTTTYADTGATGTAQSPPSSNSAQSATVNQCTVSTSVTAGGNNTGTPTVVISTIDPNGLLLEYVYNESLLAKVTQDQYHGATAGQEQITITGPAAQNPTLSYLWPAGSGTSTTLNVVDPNQSNGTANNQLNNSAFKTFSGNVPVSWTVDVGSSQIQDGTSSNYAGSAHCLEFVGDGATLTSLYQSFANAGVSGGSTVSLSPQTVYLFNAYVKLSAGSPAAGVLTFSLTDGSGNVLNDNNGTAQTITYTLTAVSDTNYHAVSGALRTPTIMPTTGVRLRIKLTTALSSGKNVFIDYAALSKPAQTGSYGGLYAGGPYVSVFRGNVDCINYQPVPLIGDVWTLAVNNNYGGNSPDLNFQTVFNRIFGMAGLGIILPSASGGGSTIADSLIS